MQVVTHFFPPPCFSERTPLISVVVPAYNAASTLDACLQALQAQSTPKEVEVIVVDDGSTDDTAQVVQQYPGVRLLHQEHAGPAAARNRGIQEARGGVVLFTDADCRPLPGWIDQLSRPILSGEAVGAKGTYCTDQRAPVARFVQQEYEEKYNHMRRAPQIDFVDTYSAGYRRDVLIGCGAFDPTFPNASVEDQELSFRLTEQGYRLVFVPAAVVRHRHADTWLRYACKKARIGYWKALVSRRYPHTMVHDTHTPRSQKLQFALLPVLIGCAVLALFWKPAGWLLALGAGGYLLSMLPLLRQIMVNDPLVLPVTPLLILTRALALGAGFARGILDFWLVQIHKGRRRLC